MVFEIGSVVYNAKNGKGIVTNVGQTVIVRHDSGKGARYGLDGMGVDGRLHFFQKQGTIQQNSHKGHDATD